MCTPAKGDLPQPFLMSESALNEGRRGLVEEGGKLGDEEGWTRVILCTVWWRCIIQVWAVQNRVLLFA